MKNTAPKEGLIANKRSRFSNEENLRKILETQPEMLKLFGLDPDQVREELEQVDRAREDIDRNYDIKVE